MRLLALTIVVSFALGIGLASEPRFWGIEIEWGDSIPAGTVYNVKFDSTGRFKAERRSLPIGSNGELTTIVHEDSVGASDRDKLRESVERCIRNINLNKAQGTMVGDGGHVHMYLWDGTVTLAAHLNKLSSNAEGGQDVVALLASLTRRLPEGFIK